MNLFDQEKDQFDWLDGPSKKKPLANVEPLGANIQQVILPKPEFPTDDQFSWLDGLPAGKKPETMQVKAVPKPPGVAERAMNLAKKLGLQALVTQGISSAKPPDLRVDGTPKGAGFFGPLKRPDGMVSTELSAGISGPEFGGKETLVPLLVPTLSRSEIDYLLAGNKPTDEIVAKAKEYALSRIQSGKSPFAGPGEQREPPEYQPSMRAMNPVEKTAAELEALRNVTAIPPEKLVEPTLPGEIIPAAVKTLGGGFLSAASKTAGVLNTYAQKLGKLIGVQPGGIFKQLSDNWDYYAKELQGRGFKAEGERVSPTEKTFTGFLGGVGAAGFDIPMIYALGPEGLAIHGAIMGGAEKGLEGALIGAAQGRLMKGFLAATSRIPAVVQPLAGGVAFGLTVPGGLKEKAEAFTIGSVLTLTGGRQAPTWGEFFDAYKAHAPQMTEHDADMVYRDLTGQEKPKITMSAKALVDETINELNKGLAPGQPMADLVGTVGKPETWRQPPPPEVAPRRITAPATYEVAPGGTVIPKTIPEAQRIQVAARAAEIPPEERPLTTIQIRTLPDGTIEITPIKRTAEEVIKPTEEIPPRIEPAKYAPPIRMAPLPTVTPKAEIVAPKKIPSLKQPKLSETPFISWIRKQGGIDYNSYLGTGLGAGEVQNIMQSSAKSVFKKKGGGMKITLLAEKARDEGYIKAAGPEDVLAAIDQEVAGKPQPPAATSYEYFQQARAKQEEAAIAAEAERYNAEQAEKAAPVKEEKVLYRGNIPTMNPDTAKKENVGVFVSRQPIGGKIIEATAINLSSINPEIIPGRFEKIQESWKNLKDEIGYVSYDKISKDTNLPVQEIGAELKAQKQNNPYLINFSSDRMGANVGIKIKSEREQVESRPPEKPIETKQDLKDSFGPERTPEDRAREERILTEIDEAIKKGKELTPEQKDLLEKQGIYKEVPAATTIPRGEEEIAVSEEGLYEGTIPEGQMKLVRVSIKTPTGEYENLGEISPDKIDEIRQYAKKFGVEDNLKIGQEFIGRWKESISPEQIEKFMKDIIRDVKNIPKETWELYAGYPFTKEIKRAVLAIKDRSEKRRFVANEELRNELQKTDAGKVEWMYHETDRAIKEKTKPTFKKAFAWSKRAFVDTSGNIKKALIKDLGPLGKEAVVQHDLLAGASAKAQRMYEEAEKGIYKGISKEEEMLLNRAIQSRRTIAISKYRPDVKHPMGLTEKEHGQYLKGIPPEIQKRADVYFKEMEKVLDRLKGEGLLSKQDYENLKEKGDYSPRRFIQYIDPEVKYNISGRTITVGDSGLKRLDEGSIQVMETNSRLFLSNVLGRTESRIFRNKANVALYNLAKEIPDNGIVSLAKVGHLTKEGEPVYESAKGGFTKIKVMVEGKPKEMTMPYEYAREWILRDPLVDHTQANIIGWVSGSKILKPLATGINPGFALTNMPRDILHVWFTTQEYSKSLVKYPFQIAKDYFETAKDAFSRKGAFKDYVDEGGLMNFLTLQGRTFPNASAKLRNLQEVLGYIGETSEIWTRLALRNRALKNGATPDEATWTARNYIDFSQGGNVTKAFDTGIPYLNASVQATRGIFRAFGEHPSETIWKFAQLGTLAAGLYVANSRVNKDCYDSISTRDKEANFIITTPFSFKDKNGNIRYLYFKIAKDQTTRMLCSVFEGLMAKVLGDKVDPDQIAQAVQDSFPIIPDQNLPPSLSAFLGYTSNKDFWRNEDVWKGPKVTPREEYTVYTDPTLIKAGEITHLSPERLGYAIKEMFTRGNIYTSLVSGGLNLLMQDLTEADKRRVSAEIITSIPDVKRVFNVTPPYSMKEIKEAEKAQVEQSTIKYKQTRELDRMASGYYRKLKDEGQEDTELFTEIKKFIGEQPAPDRKALITRFKNYGIVYKIPEKRWWLELDGMNPEARATVFWTKYLESNEEKRHELMRLAHIVPGIWTDRFVNRFNSLMSKSGKKNE